MGFDGRTTWDFMACPYMNPMKPHEAHTYLICIDQDVCQHLGFWGQTGKSLIN
jgi:hypothetical protein